MGHEPVLLSEVLAALEPRCGGVYVDATFGGGGYTRAILARADCRVIALDRDPHAVERGRELARHEPRLTMLEGCFGDMADLLSAVAIDRVDGVVLDIGVSSFQLDDPGRGFSFRADGPLDMRMGSDGPTAADLVNGLAESELTRLFRDLADEPEARFVARAIARRRAERPFATTADLAELVAATKRRNKPGRHPATLVFQALRMAVNDELGELGRALEASVDLLVHDGRLVVVGFHSAEDRLVKSFVDRASGHDRSVSRHAPLPDPRDAQARLRWIERKPVRPGPAELARNPRARSARLRAAAKLAVADDDERHRRLAA